MGKYFAVFKTSIRQESKTLTNMIYNLVSLIVIIFIFNELWGYIYGSGISPTINGYTVKNMIWYMIAAEILMYAFNARHLTKDYANDIKSGKIAYQLNKPYSYFGYRIAYTTGSFCWKMMFLLPTGILIGIILLGPIPNFSIAYVFPILFSLLLGTFTSTIMFGIIGLLAFWIEESTPFTWILQKFNMLFGLFFPPEFFPTWLQPIITYSPIYATTAGPSKLFANFSWEVFAEVTAIQVIYCLIFILLGVFIYKSGSKKVTNNGG